MCVKDFVRMLPELPWLELRYFGLTMTISILQDSKNTLSFARKAKLLRTKPECTHLRPYAMQLYGSSPCWSTYYVTHRWGGPFQVRKRSVSAAERSEIRNPRNYLGLSRRQQLALDCLRRKISCIHITF
ncbi:hypothetical protein Tcan_12312 [Toxocara canis]|uniref:Uncharacterized protein n=1 Tax=Toxocara canis TaxID=6265 RepID=A0A0B2VF65_TOXCA|nr:hypothetical protein Tcan_12312 [Toxocara canis]